MPLVTGHGLAGMMSAYYLKKDRLRPGEAIMCAGAAILPDFDYIPGLLVGIPNLFHRSLTHSFLGLILFSSMVYWAAKRLAGNNCRRWTLVLGMSYASHLLLDYIQPDTNPANGLGIPLFYPISRECYQIGWDFFPTPPFPFDVSSFSSAFHGILNPGIQHYILLETLAVGAIFGVVFVAPVCGNTQFSLLVHLFGSDLKLKLFSVVVNDRGVQ